MIRALAVLLLLLAPLPALAQTGPSFNCAQARAWDEQAICAQADLAELDRRIAAAWRSVTERATPEDRQRLQGEQRAWLAERRACQGPNAREAQSCVRRLMRARARDLEALAQGGPAGTA
ncbi:lysozyme inhibitor LprI family protein, partial [Neoroseomonas rubea]|uniref:lysozyme inhibitor LprI family protein n=1 Tax=Neoroseomonas rubea TaxID=2748666 RepID=UPI0018DF8299